MPAARVVFMGTPEFAVPALTSLQQRPDDFNVVGVWTQPDRPAGRGRVVKVGAVKQAAAAYNIPCFAPTKMKIPQTTELLAELRPTVAVVAAYGRILPTALLQIPTVGCVNLHASLLPRHRGASPVAHAIWAGDRESGVCIMAMDEGLDTGPVFVRRSLPIGPEHTTGSLTQELAQLGADLLVATLPQIIRGACVAVPQSDNGTTYAPLLRKEDGLLDLRRAATLLARQVRALHPWPGAFLPATGGRLKVIRARGDARHAGQPGEVLQADNQGVLVACGEGALWLDEIQLAGRRAMSAAAWVAGRGVAPGTQLADFSKYEAHLPTAHVWDGDL